MEDVSCPNCEQTNTLTGHNTAHYFHLFWVPIFPVQKSSEASCDYCKKGFLKEEFTEEMERALRK